MNLKPYYEEYELLAAHLTNPENLSDHAKLKTLNQRQSFLEPVVLAGRRYEELGRQIEQTKAIVASEDPQLSELGREELEELHAEYAELEQHLKVLLIPADPFDERDVIIEIRPGAGGEESALFSAELLLMYVRYSERHRWTIEVITETLTESGGYKEIIFRVKGSGAYGKLKFESGVHRVQRVPKTESQGRIHTSTVTVAVLPEADEVDVEIQDSDLRIDVFRSGGHGGQSVNTTDSAVRITHLPTGLVVTCQDEKSQLKNKLKAMSVLRARLLAMERERRQREASDQRKSQIGTGDRSEKIRTYNFPQNRVTDHRINLTLHSLQKVLDGELDELIEALALESQAEELAGQSG